MRKSPDLGPGGESFSSVSGALSAEIEHFSNHVSTTQDVLFKKMYRTEDRTVKKALLTSYAPRVV